MVQQGVGLASGEHADDGSALSAAGRAASTPDDGASRSPFHDLTEFPGGLALAERLTALGAGHADPGALIPPLADDVAGPDAGQLVELVAAWERVAAWASAQSAAAAARLSETPEMNPAWPDRVGRPRLACLAGTELSLRLGRTVRSATRLVDTGRMLATVLTDTGDAFAAGHIDRAKAEVFAEVLAEVPGEVALEAEALVLPDAPRMTVTQLRARLAAAVLAADPLEAQARHAAARGGRRVTRPQVLPDGMASMTAIMPADAAVRLDACLRSAAEVARRRPGEHRTLDQLRADALDALAVAAWDAGRIGPAEVHAERAPGEYAEEGWSLVGARGRRTHVHVTVGLGTLLGLDEQPAELAGYGPVGADVARALAADGTWRRLLADDTTGAVLDVGAETYEPPAAMVRLIRERNKTCVFPTCAVPARLCETDHTVPFGDRHGGRTSADNLGPLCTTHHLYKTHGGYRLEQPAPGSFVLTTPTGHVHLTGPDRPPGLPAEDPRRTHAGPRTASPVEDALTGHAGDPSAPAGRWWIHAPPAGWGDLVTVEPSGHGHGTGTGDAPTYDDPPF